MKIGKLTIRLNGAGIRYNSSTELGTDKGRGSVLDGGKVVRGLGTHFDSLEAKQRFDRLTARSNEIRSEFNRTFVRFELEGTYVLNDGDAAKFEAKFEGDKPDVIVEVSEYDVYQSNKSERQLIEWARRFREQAKQTPLGRGKDIDDQGLAVLLSYADCPVIDKETQDYLKSLVAQVKLGSMTRMELKRNISEMEVKMNPNALLPDFKRNMPEDGKA